MHKSSNRATKNGAHRSPKAALNPYCVDETSFTLSEILRARAADPVTDGDR